jgi:hypothetical protein
MPDTAHNSTGPGRPLLILRELGEHAPFTFLGAAAGLIGIILLRNITTSTAHGLFVLFHPAHVIFSAIVTASLYKLRKRTSSLLGVIVVGYLGSVGIATLSDCVLPFFGEQILGVPVPSEGSIHGGHPAGRHSGVIEDWYIVNPAALVGIAMALVAPHTKLPHAIHIFLSTFASVAHILMNMQAKLTIALLFGILVVLFIAVWVPCCVSDIVFPMLFVRGPDGSSQSTQRSCGHEH